MNRTLSLISVSEDSTRGIGRALGSNIMPGLTVLLYGDLGAGKTVLVRGIGDALGVGDRVRSPSFTLVNEYAADKLVLAHADLYRLEAPSDVDALGLEEYMVSPDTALLVEWPERWASPPENNVLKIEIRALDERQRALTFSPVGEDAKTLTNALEKAVKSGECPGVEITREHEENFSE